MLFLYACADYYLREGGRLGFVITQEVFKAKGAGEGFRRFRLGEEGAYLRVLKAGDLVTVKPFENAANKTATIILQKGMETSYPVPYTVWQRKKGIGHIDTGLSLEKVIELTDRDELLAQPIGNKLESAWQTTKVTQREALDKLHGTTDYRGHIGARVDPYGVFLVRLLQVREDGLLLVENLAQLGKRDMPSVKELVEPDLVFPIIRGRDISRWLAKPEICAIIPQDPAEREGYAESRMKLEWPYTYAYLLRFREVLLSRGSRVIRELAERTVFYTTYSVGPYTFVPYRVSCGRGWQERWLLA